MSNPINLAVVGCGYWGPNLLRNFRSIPGFEVRYACDQDTTRRAHMASLYPGVEPIEDFSYLLNGAGVDAMAIATSVGSHYELAKRSLLAGKHTFVEKPMALSTAQCKELIGLARERHLTLMVGHTFIYSAPVRKMRELVRSGELGEIFYISSQRLNLGLFQKDINVTWDLAPHDISIILYVLPEAPVSVNCQGKSHINPGIEDVTSMCLNFPNGGFATIQSSWLDPNKIRKMTVVGSKKMILYDDTEPLEKLKIFDKHVEAPPHYDSFAEFHYSYHYGDMHSPYLQQTEPLRMECEHFLECISQDKTPESSGEDGLDVVRVLEAAEQSLRQGGNNVTL